MKTAIVDAAADIEKLLGYFVVDILKLGVYVEAWMLLHELHHIFILFVLNIIAGKLVQAAFGYNWNHVLDVGVDRQRCLILVLYDVTLDFCDILIDWVIRLPVVNASFQGCHILFVIFMTVIVQIAYSFQCRIELSSVFWAFAFSQAARLTALQSNGETGIETIWPLLPRSSDSSSTP